MTFGYARVSTKTQARDGNSLDAQQAALTAAGAEKIYTDTFTGTKIERPEFDRLRAQLRRGDVLIVTRLDRLARSVSQASGLITEMIDEGITINVLNLGILSNDSVNTLLRNVLLSFAQFERDMIVQRTQEGKAVARDRPGFPRRASAKIRRRAARPRDGAPRKPLLHADRQTHRHQQIYAYPGEEAEENSIHMPSGLRTHVQKNYLISTGGGIGGKYDGI